ncbi:MAG: mismatch-specific DNA-glycosylase [Candidatus Sericytochromatia bacterium]|nr:mismatch-specific DNA-glycosylase [Candidatus Tanganyikabacteria bacterium]
MDSFAPTGLRVILPDLLRPGLRLVFCGTAAGHHSARKRAYYAGPGNRFWPTLRQIGLTPGLLDPEDYGQLLMLDIGLTDLAKHVAGADADLTSADYDVPGLESRIAVVAPVLLAFTSKEAARVALRRKVVDYGVQRQHAFTRTEVHVLPSPSGRATAYWSVGPWQALADRFREVSGQT